ncbi:MAG TPA: PQQ-dependent sugar dehydrogenase, partial [Chloroflexota bacterium]|nr:PQQ-dependent sugar dehydrogenase [Chloroflexota bacterium]
TSTTWAPAGATFVTHGPWRGSFLFTGLASQGLFRLTLDPAEPHTVLNLEVLLQRQFGRLRDVVEGPDGALYLLTSNRDGRGNPAPDDDRIVRLIVS